MVLGSAQDGGLPQVGASHGYDEAARRGVLAERTASSVAVVGEEATLLLDASPDIRRQLAALEAARSAAPPVREVALTHGHMGHYAGLLHFGKEAAAGGVTLYVTPSMKRFLAANEPWASLGDFVDVVAVAGPVKTQSGFTLRFIEVPHRAEHTDAVAISVDGRLLYLPDIDSWDEWPDAEEVIADHAMALVDATFFDDGEVPGRDMSTFPHPRVVDTIERFAHLTDTTRIVLTHLNHTNPLVDPHSPQHQAVLAAGFEVAADMLVLEI